MNIILKVIGISMCLAALWGGFYVAIEIIPSEIWSNPLSKWWGFPACVTTMLASIGLCVFGVNLIDIDID